MSLNLAANIYVEQLLHNLGKGLFLVLTRLLYFATKVEWNCLFRSKYAISDNHTDILTLFLITVLHIYVTVRKNIFDELPMNIIVLVIIF